MKESMEAFVLEGDGENVSGKVTEFPTASLPDGDVTIRATHSAIDYKDAMIAAGVGRMARNFPHVAGVDLAGEVEADRRGTFKAGDKVPATGYDLGVGRFGGYAQYARLPAERVVPLPAGGDIRQPATRRPGLARPH